MKASLAVLLLAIVFLCGPTIYSPMLAVSAAGATNEEIREGVSSLMHSVNVIDDKLGRHEGRERVLGESIRKGLAALQKGQQALPLLKTSFSRMEERVGQMESMLVAQEERAIVQQNKLADALESIYKFMNDNSNAKYAIVQNKEDSDEEDLPKKIDDLLETIKELRREVSELKADRASADSEAKGMIHRSSVVLMEAMGSKLDEKLASLYVTAPNAQAEFEQQVKDALAEIQGKMSSSPSTGLSSRIGGGDAGDSSKTLEAIEDLKVEVLTAVDKSLIKISSRIQESSNDLQTVVNDIAKTVTEQAEGTAGMQENQEKILKNTENVKNLDVMLLQTADNIFDTKKKIELSVHRIHQDVSEMMRQSTKDLNATLMERLDTLDKTIVENHLGALTNLSTKIETEMSQVWRQIGIMYKEISASKMSLDRLQQQTEQYVNGTINTMDNMKGKVGMITDRMTEVDDNLNYLLGRLSLVTQEFNQIKSGLGEALESIRSSFQSVKNTVRETVGPGPHPIESHELGPEPDNHLMRKRLIRRRV